MALKNNPEIKRATLELNSLDARETEAKLFFVPRAVLGAGLIYNSKSEEWEKPFGLSFVSVLYEYRKTLPRIRSAKLRAQAQREVKRQLERDLKIKLLEPTSQNSAVLYTLGDKGQRVNKDQPLVEINPDLYLAEKERLTAQLEAQRLKLEKTERDFKRYEELYNRGLLSKSEYEDWKNRYERERATYLSLEAELKGVEKLIEYCQIRAPTSGVVKKVFVREQSFINGTLSPHLLLILSED